MKHPNLIFSLELELEAAKKKKAELKPIDLLTRITHVKLDMIIAEWEHGLGVLRTLDDI